MIGRPVGPLRFISGENQGRYPYCNSLYIEEAGVLIDPGSDRKVLKRLRDTGGVQQVWLSHWHEDHLSHLDLFEGIPLRMSARDRPPLENLETFLDWYAMDNPEYRTFWKAIMVDQFHYSPRRPDRCFEDGELIDLGSLTVEVIPTPGHTPGHLTFYFREPKILFMGDYDLTAFGPWYGDLYSDIDQTLASIRRLQGIPAKYRLTGHENGLFTETPETLWSRYKGVIHEREAKLLRLLTEPKTLDEIAAAWIVYGRPREPLAFYEFGERAIMGKHLQRLAKNDRVVQDNGIYLINRQEVLHGEENV